MNTYYKKDMIAIWRYLVEFAKDTNNKESLKTLFAEDVSTTLNIDQKTVDLTVVIIAIHCHKKHLPILSCLVIYEENDRDEYLMDSLGGIYDERITWEEEYDNFVASLDEVTKNPNRTYVLV